MFKAVKRCYSEPSDHKALSLLDDPSHFPGLPELQDHKIAVQLFLMPSFEPSVSWTVYRLSESVSRIRRVRWHNSMDYRLKLARLSPADPEIYGADVDCPSSKIDAKLSQLAALSLPLFDVPTTVGIDGVNYGLRRRAFGHLTEFSWWCEPPKGCEAVAIWYRQALSEFEAFLPAQTDLFRQTASRP